MKNKIILSIVTIIVVAIFAFIYWLKPEDNLNANIQNNSNNSSVKQTNQNINSPNSSSIQPVNQLSVAPISTANGQKEFQMPNTNWQDRELLINGKKIKENYIKENMNTEDLSIDIPKGKVFVMGDNRNHSLDSRKLGYFDFDNDVIGKVFFKIPL